MLKFKDFSRVGSNFVKIAYNNKALNLFLKKIAVRRTNSMHSDEILNKICAAMAVVTATRTVTTTTTAATITTRTTSGVSLKTPPTLTTAT